MTIAQFTFPCDKATLSKNPRLITAETHGFEARQAAGYNANPQAWDVEFTFHGASAHLPMKAFLDARAGTIPFEWTAPVEGAQPWFYTCEDYSFTATGTVWKATATFRQYFGVDDSNPVSVDQITSTGTLQFGQLDDCLCFPDGTVSIAGSV